MEKSTERQQIVHPDSQKTLQNLMREQQFELVTLWSNSEEWFTIQLRGSSDRTATNLESIMGRRVLPHSSEEPFLGLSPYWALSNTSRSDRLQFACQVHRSTVSRLWDSLPAPRFLSSFPWSFRELAPYHKPLQDNTDFVFV